jgi:hypothetical protein
MQGDHATMRRLLAAPAYEYDDRNLLTVTADQDNALFGGGILSRAAKWIGVGRSEPRYVIRRALIAIALGWLPLLVLTAIQSALFGTSGLESFAADLAVHGRSLVAVPVLVLADLMAPGRLSQLADHFVECGVVSDVDRARFGQIRASIRMLRDSRLAEVVVVTLAICTVLVLARFAPPNQFQGWQTSASGSAFSAAGWYHALISVPLLLTLFYSWLWRLFLWSRFVWLASALDLRLIPCHPDHSGGLKFVGYSVVHLAPLGFAVGTIIGGTVANHVARGTMAMEDAATIAVATTICVVGAFVGPLLVFARRLTETWLRGLFRYGALAQSVGDAFERKWLAGVPIVHESALESQDFSATTDLYQVVSNVYAMRIVPVEWTSLAVLIAATLLPFLPAALILASFDELLSKMAGFLF